MGCLGHRQTPAVRRSRPPRPLLHGGHDRLLPLLPPAPRSAVGAAVYAAPLDDTPLVRPDAGLRFLICRLLRFAEPEYTPDLASWQGLVKRVEAATRPVRIGLTILGVGGRYGKEDYPKLPQIPEWWDLGVVILFALGIFYYAVDMAMSSDKVKAAVQFDVDNMQAFILPELPELAKSKP